MTHHTGSDEGRQAVFAAAFREWFHSDIDGYHAAGHAADPDDCWHCAEAAESAARAAAPDALRERVEALADEWTRASCQTDGAPCSWHRVSAECAGELRAALAERPTDGAAT